MSLYFLALLGQGTYIFKSQRLSPDNVLNKEQVPNFLRILMTQIGKLGTECQSPELGPQKKCAGDMAIK